MRNSRVSRKAKGFSLIELLIVVAMILVITAMAAPTLMRSIADMKLRGRVIAVQGLLQTARMRAVRDNKTYQVVSANLSDGETQVFIDLDGDGLYDNGEPSVSVSPLSPLGTKGDAPTKTTLYTDLGVSSTDFTGYQGGTTSINIKFNPRGLPCSGALSSLCIDNEGYVYYFQDTRGGVTGPGPVWAALAITKAGRMKTYLYLGSSWQ
jgi:prepilin-type N-terminal cleavage/methylation domain-containing protein